jgi:hypothetical protein
MNLTGIEFVLAGIILIVIAQAYGAIKTFSVSPTKGVFGLIVPGYIWITAKRHDFSGWLFSLWFTGIIGVILGTVILS